MYHWKSQNINDTARLVQLCVDDEGGYEVAVHVINQEFNSSKFDAVIQIDASNALIHLTTKQLSETSSIYAHPLPECLSTHVNQMLVPSLKEKPFHHKRAQQKGTLLRCLCMLLEQFSLSINYPMNP